MKGDAINTVSEDGALPSIWKSGFRRRMSDSLKELWSRCGNAVSIALFGISGSAVAGSFLHVLRACGGQGCVGCGNCVAALATGVAAASAGFAGRASGRKRRLLIMLTALVGLLLYSLLEALKSGFLV